jgi:hypothetical protein
VVGVVILYTIVVLSLGGMPAARPAFYCLAGFWIALLALHTIRIHRLEPLRPSFQVIEVVLTNVALALLLSEGALRIFATWSGDSVLLRAAVDGYRLTPGRDYGGGLRGNSLGYPVPEFQCEKQRGVYRIAALGDSFAIGPAVPFADNYLTRLDHLLPHAEVYNFGVAGIGPREYLLILQRDVWRFQPDLILLSIFVGNDITETLSTPRHLDPRQHALYLLCQRAWRIGWGTESRDDTRAEQRLAGPPLSLAAFRAVEARRLAVCLRSPPEGLEKKWQRALSYLTEIVKDCKRYNTPLAVVLIPDEFQVNLVVRADALNDAGVNQVAVDLELPQRRLSAFFQGQHVACLDLLPAFTNAPDTYAVRDTHWNARGNRLAADEINRWLRRILLISPDQHSLMPHGQE